ncbi:hypothetical protein MTR_8g026770 [Medicago truncatula]|uniref:Uncharacterized protein n=1 Tax=Medicago truncatula TaxID=3880 RepID=G7L9Z8_MEDTR|nr:hypothetical protein MTR_8g026770 [Medicago truncatula]
MLSGSRTLSSRSNANLWSWIVKYSRTRLHSPQLYASMDYTYTFIASGEEITTRCFFINDL